MNGIEGLTQGAAFMRERNVGPEGMAFVVLTTDTETARKVGPMLAGQLHPTIRFGAVIHVEPIDDATEVVVEVVKRSAP